MCIIKAFSISLLVLRSHLYFCQFMGQNDELYTLTYSLVHYIFLVTYDVSKVKTIEAKEGETIWCEIEFKGGDLPKATTKWQKESNSSFQGSGTLKIEKLSKHHAGKYIFRVIDAGSGLVRATYTINIWVEISLSLEFEIKIRNWIYTEQLKNRSSTEYKEFERHFHKEMNKAYANFTGYQGVEIKELRNGSTHVRYRFKSITVVKSSSQTTTGAKVKASQILINNARDGYIGQLQIDSSPEAMKISAPPPSPENFRLLGVTKDGAHIAWDRPKNSPYFLIKGYNIEYWKFGSSTKKTSKTFKDISIRLSGLEPETSYVARVIAINDNGRGLESDKIDIKTEAKQLPKWTIAVIVIVVFVCLLVIILVFLCYRRRKKRIAAARAEMTMKRLDKMKESYPKSYFNLGNSFTISEKCTVFSRERFALLYEVGSGQFGVVYRGQLLNDNNEFIDCAVKTYKETASDEDVRDLYQELDIMVNIGRHKNLVNVIGACEEPGKRKGRDQLYLLVEFAQHGSLISYLKEQRENPTENPEFELHYMNRLKLAHGVARGMAFLASKRCVHRDLAARNVLLGDRFVAKVADFGLSRDIYETGEYEKTTSGKLPVKWMAIESLEQRKFSLETDVWSFGVLLWEIETKGLMPHGALSFKDLVHKQKEGYRLEQPAGTPDKLYRLMGICWSADPKKRPTFSQLCKLLDVLKTEQKQEHRVSSANSLTKKTVGLQLESPGESFNSAM